MNWLLGQSELLQHITDHAWPGFKLKPFGIDLVWMSSSIASMLLVAAVLMVVILPYARRRQRVPSGTRNVLEAAVIFVREVIAKPALHDKADNFLPMLLSLFVFILGMNLLGLIPLANLSELVGLGEYRVGGTATSVITVTGGLAFVALCAIIIHSLKAQAIRCHHRHHLPLVLCAILSPWLWLKSLSPHIPGAAGVVLFVPMMLMEFVGVFARCFALMIRLFANMLAGHTLVAVMMMFVAMTLSSFLKSQSPHIFYIAPLCVLASAAAGLLDLLVSFVQAYIFTFLTAVFIGLYTQPGH